MATIQDVAKMAGVSVATISRVLNNSERVSDNTREKVLKVIKELNYNPNLLGRNLRRSETRMILVLLPYISNPFYSAIVRGIEDKANEKGYNVMLCDTHLKKDTEKTYMKLLKNKLFDGIIVMSSELDGEELYEISKSFPLVQCCEYKEEYDIPYVSINNEKAAYSAVKYLIELGNKRIGMISSTNTYISTRMRESGYQKAMKDFKIEEFSQIVRMEDYSFEKGYEAAKIMMANNKIGAIFAISDILAIGAIKAIKEAKLRVPEDIQVIGFDNISFSYMYSPAVTTISQNRYNLGTKAFEILIKQINNQSQNVEKVFIDFKLIIRESTL